MFTVSMHSNTINFKLTRQFTAVFTCVIPALQLNLHFIS
ncbi:putative membrane protein [Collimonas pratensis]|uniref:Membrane protein n=1 Tax=Collimonas pratensis TaxID=279113 RepID=A0ABM5Z2G0_9BURK|nr:putative membrane protein [Collimonas pratensis]